MKKKRLTRSREDRIIFGVLGGLAEYFEIDSTVVRFIFLFLFFILDDYLVPAYLIAALVIPKAPREQEFDVEERERQVEQPKEATKKDWSDF